MRVAIVGAGVSGISALWLLNEYSEHEVNIYEKNDYPGGHTNTQTFKRDGKESCQVDTGFIVLNPPTYPNFLRFLQHQKVPLLNTEMTFAVSQDRGKFEWAGEGLGGVFCQIGNLLNPRLYRMLFDVLRFNVFAKDILRGRGPGAEGISIGEYLDRENYGDGFKEDYLLPMTAAIWSTPADKAGLDFPASTLIRFFWNHHLMQITGKPKWLTVKGGSKLYVDSVLAKLPKENLHLNTEIVSVRSVPEGVELVEAGGARHIYDHVIMASHSDTTLKILRKGGGVTAEEEKALAPWQWSHNEAVLHWDERLMPVRRRAYSAWNYLTSTTQPSKKVKSISSAVNTVSLTYSMNILQHLPEEKHGLVLVTLNPPFEPDPAKVVGRFQYEHPMMTGPSVDSQALLPAIQNKRNITYAGAWTKYGFHEDGFASGMRLACSEIFGAKPPFEIRPARRDVGPAGLGEHVARAVLGGIQTVIVRGEPVWLWISWVMVLVLTAAERSAASMGLQGSRAEIVRIKRCWASPEGKKKQ